MEGNRLKQRVNALLEEALAGRPDLFLLEFEVTPDHVIKITLDGDRGVNLHDCMDISRAVEHSLDREEFDFSLEVGSAGAAAPLQLPRQYGQHVGRTLEVVHGGGTTEGTLLAADETKITLGWKAREPKPVGKGKHTVRKETSISFSDIEQAKVVLKF